MVGATKFVKNAERWYAAPQMISVEYNLWQHTSLWLYALINYIERQFINTQ